MTKVCKILGLPAALSVLGAPVFIHTSHVDRDSPPQLGVYAYAGPIVAITHRPGETRKRRIVVQVDS